VYRDKKDGVNKMKKIILSLAFVFIVHCTLYVKNCEGQWTWISPKPQGNMLNQMTLLNNKIFSAGLYGTIISSTNDGVNWDVIHNVSEVNSEIVSLFKLNDFVLFAITYNGILLKSTDIGISWTAKQTPLNYVKNIFFVNENYGFINNGYSIYKTINAGNNWTPAYSTSGFTINDVYFLDANTGIIGGGQLFDAVRLLKTTDGGSTWNIQISAGGSEITRLKLLDNNNGYAFSWGSVYKTTNGGNNWILYNISGADRFTDFQFFNINTGYGVCQNQSMYKTMNGGMNWTEYPTPYYSFIGWGLNSMYFTNIQTGYVLKDKNYILKTTNAGSNWIKLTSSFNDYAPVRSIKFINNTTGFWGSWSSGNNNVIFKSTDAGLSWFSVYASNISRGHVNDITFPTNQTGYAVGGTSGIGYVYKSTDSGNNWSCIDSMGINSNYKVHFIDNYTGLVLNGYKEIYRTTNGGSSWTVFNFGSSYTINSFCFINNLTGFACGGSGTSHILKTTNTGLNWYFLSSLTNTTFNSVYFVNGATGYISGKGIYKSTDGGVSWIQKIAGNPPYYGKIFFANENIGYSLVNDYVGGIVKTINAGETWYELKKVSSTPFSEIYFLNENTGFCAGDNGRVIKTTNGGGGPIGINVLNNKIPKKFSLFQNYPNPFNPSTVISFSIGIPSGQLVVNSYTKLVVYDILGNEVSTLVNEQLKPGTYEVEFNGDNFASGVYYYTLQTESFNQTKRMVLLK
jgi:photosystem II stability/assembly factor-like uncharacterized protein